MKDKWFKNMKGNARRLLDYLKAQMKSTFNVEVAFILHSSWFKSDPTITTKQAYGKHGWFTPSCGSSQNVHTWTRYNGRTFGAVAPSYRERH